MKKPLLILPLSLILFSASADPLTFQLAKELLNENSYELSAVEFRRFAMETDKDAEQSAAYLYSSYAYLQSKQALTASEMLDMAENTGASSDYMNEHTLLSAENARMQQNSDTALYFYEVLSSDATAPEYQTFSRRRAAAIHLSQGNLEAARSELNQSASDETRSIQALDAFESGSNKSPAVGGLMGLIPGAGYWYSGEIANGFRSLILNSLFLFGMYQTAEDEQWGAFAVITFFEVTWYSGSIYGGMDAAHRFNQDRIDTALYEIEGDLSYQPDPEIVIPVFKLNIHF